MKTIPGDGASDFVNVGGMMVRVPKQNFCTQYFIGDDVPIRIPESKQPTRWQCSYCKGLRLGEQCEGCGAPRHQAALTARRGSWHGPR